MITHRYEVGKVGAQHVVDLRLPGGGVVQVVEIALVHDGVGALVLDQLQHGPWTVPRTGRLPALVADEGDGDVDRPHAGGVGDVGRLVAAAGQRQSRDHGRRYAGALPRDQSRPLCEHREHEILCRPALR